MRYHRPLYKKIFLLFLIYWAYGCGGSTSKEADFIPPYIDPNGGPVLKINVGDEGKSSKSKSDNFQKRYTESVKAYKLDGSLIGSASKLPNQLWQIQVPDGTPVIIKAKLLNSSSGSAEMEMLIPQPQTGTFSINKLTTQIVYLCYLNNYLQSLSIPQQQSDLAASILLAQQDYLDLSNNTWLQKAIQQIPSSGSNTERLHSAEVIVKKFLAFYSLYFKVETIFAQLESGALNISVPSTSSTMFDIGNYWDLSTLTATLNATILTKSIASLASSSLWNIVISQTSIIVETIPSSEQRVVLFQLSAIDIANIKSFFSTPNTPPVFTSKPVTTALINTPYSYTLQASDANNDTLKYSAVQIPSWLTLSGVELKGTPTSADVGATTIIVAVTDNRIASAITQSYTLTVLATPVNNPPQFTSTPQTSVVENDLYYYKVTATDSEGDPITLSAETLPTWLGFNSTTGVLQGTPKKADIGTHSIVIQATDNHKISAQEFTITVTPDPTNNAPVFTTASTLYATEGVAFSQEIKAEDIDGDVLTFTAKTLPEWLSFDPQTNILSGTPTNGDYEKNKVVLTVTDGKITKPIELTITIVINTIPVIHSTPLRGVIVGNIYQYKVLASDRDQDPVSISAISYPTWMTYDATTAVLSGVPSNSHIGIYDVSLRATDNKAVASGLQDFKVRVFNNLFMAKVNDVEVTNAEEIKLADMMVNLSIKPRDTGANLTLKIKLENQELTLTNSATSVLLTNVTQQVEFIAIDAQQNTTSLKVTLKEDNDRKVKIELLDGAKISDHKYRKIPEPITVKFSFYGNIPDPIILRSILLDNVPQSLNNSGDFILDPMSVSAGSHTITAKISYKNTSGETITSASSLTIEIVNNHKPTQTIKINDFVITSDITHSLHDGDSVLISTSSHADGDNDPIQKGLYIDGVLNDDLTSYTVTLAANQTKTIKTYLRDPYDISDAITITVNSTGINGGIPITLNATGVTLSNNTSIYRDTINGEPNMATITASFGTDPEHDGVGSIEWLVNNVVQPDQTEEIFVLDLSTYGGSTVLVTCKVTDDYTPSPATTATSISLQVNHDTKPSFLTGNLDSNPIAPNANIAVDHTLSTSKIYIPNANDPEGDHFTYRFTFNGETTEGTQIAIPNSTLNGSVLTVNLIQSMTVVATNTHNISSNNIVPTPIFIGNPSHIDLNGNYEFIVKPGIDLEGDKLTTTVTLNGVPIIGVVIGNEIHYSVDLSSLGGTTVTLQATNDDQIATPIQTTFTVSVILSLPPANLTAKRGNTSITLKWDSVSSANTYNIYYGTAVNITKASTKISSVKSPYTLNGLVNGTTYYFRIAANHITAEGTLSTTDIPMTPHAAGDTLVVTIQGQNFNFRYVPAGTFTMGAPMSELGFEGLESPQHLVTISKEFWMLQNEVTQNQWAAIITNAHPTISDTPSFHTGGTKPVENISWEDIAGDDGFLIRLHQADTNTSLASGLYLLPTEAQWEYAYRANTTARFYWGVDSTLSQIATYAWYKSNSSETKAIAGKTANAWGLFDMSGNVSEWCQDKAPYIYTTASATDPQGNDIGNERIYRGGSWYDIGNHCRAAKRYIASKDIKGSNLGFRIIRVPLDTE